MRYKRKSYCMRIQSDYSVLQVDDASANKAVIVFLKDDASGGLPPSGEAKLWNRL
jgi:hypothetical protein